jgi:hypothetical protein
MKLDSISGHNRKTTYVLAAACVVSLAIALAVGIDDNLPGISMLYLSGIMLILVFVHHWRRVKKFLFLAGFAALGFIVFVLLHNFAHGGADLAEGVAVLEQLLEAVSLASFFLALIVCPAAFVVGLAGAVILFNKTGPGSDGGE